MSYRELRRTYLSTKVGILPANDVRRARGREDATGCSINLSPEDDGLSVMATFRLQEHFDEELGVSFELVDPTNEVLASAAYTVIPEGDLYAIVMRIKADMRLITEDEVWGAMYEMLDAVHLRWRVVVVDSTKRQIGRKVVGHEICGD